MKRTTIMLPEELKAKATRRARKKGISLGNLIRQSLEGELKKPTGTLSEDPLFNDTVVFMGDTPSDLSKNHDRYLYDDES